MNQGRTLWEMLVDCWTGYWYPPKKEEPSPLELRYNNPLGAKLGTKISFDHDPDLRGVNFNVEKIAVYETRIGAYKVEPRKVFWHTDYLLKGISPNADKPIRLRLRLVTNENSFNKYGSDLQVLYLMDEFVWDENFYNDVLCAENKEFHIDKDRDGTPYDPPLVYWRVEDVSEPYKAKVTTLKDDNGDGRVGETELEIENTTYWDYHRNKTDDDGNVLGVEFLWVEMDNVSKYFMLYTGVDISTEQFQVI